MAEPETEQRPDGHLANAQPPVERASDDTALGHEERPHQHVKRVPVVASPAASGAAHDARHWGSGPSAAFEAVARSARLPDLVLVTQKILGEAKAHWHGGWDFSAKVAAAADEAKLPRAEADTPFGNALKVLGAGPDGDAERALACALWAHAIAESRRGDEERLAGDVLWLATHTPFDATPLLDRALAEDADELWRAIGERIRRIHDGRGGALGRGEAIVGCASLASSSSAAARRVASDLASALKDPTLLRVLSPAPTAARGDVLLEGECVPPPRGPFVTAILALTGVLFVVYAARLFARFALAHKRPARVSISESGVRVSAHTEMLGRTLRDEEHVIPRAGLLRVVREVRYPRAAFYAGLFALAIGSYVGIRTFVDGVRAASPSLLLGGMFVIALGIGADFVLGSLLPGARGRIRLAFVPRVGKTVCVADVDSKRADDALARSLAPR